MVDISGGLEKILYEKQELWIKNEHTVYKSHFLVGYLISYNEDKMQAICSIERLTSESIKDNIPTKSINQLPNQKKTNHQTPIRTNKKNVKFKNCDFISKIKGVPNHPTRIDFKNSNYTKGHIAAAANHKSNEEEHKETFLYINVLPEAKHLMALQKLEAEVRDLTNENEEVYVISGPIYEYTGNNINLLNGRIPIPTHLFKVIICMEKGTEKEVKIYKIPNKNQSGKKKKISILQNTKLILNILINYCQI